MRCFARHLLLAVVVPALAAAAPAASDEVNAAALDAGAREIDADGQVRAEAATAFDGRLSTEWQPLLGQAEVVLQLAEPFDVLRLVVFNSRQEEGSPGISAKQLVVETGPGPFGPWKPLVSPLLEKGDAPQAIPAAAPAVRFLRLRLAANHGHAERIALAELRVMGRRTKARKVAFTGGFMAAAGEMKLTQTGKRVTGCWGMNGDEPGDHVLEGTAEGPLFVGTWHDASGAGGTIAFALTAENELSGVWGTNPDGGDRTSRWDAEKLRMSTIRCAAPAKN